MGYSAITVSLLSDYYVCGHVCAIYDTARPPDTHSGSHIAALLGVCVCACACARVPYSQKIWRF